MCSCSCVQGRAHLSLASMFAPFSISAVAISSFPKLPKFSQEKCRGLFPYCPVSGVSENQNEVALRS